MLSMSAWGPKFSYLASTEPYEVTLLYLQCYMEGNHWTVWLAELVYSRFHKDSVSKNTMDLWFEKETAISTCAVKGQVRSKGRKLQFEIQVQIGEQVGHAIE